MHYKVLKASIDGICGGASRYTKIQEVLNEISWFKGWDSKEQLHDAIKRWAQTAKPGSIFCTQASAIVCCPK